MTGHPIFTVTLVFAPPGPLHCAMLVAPNLETAVAMVTLEAAKVAGDAGLAAVVASELPADALRRILRAAEGQTGPAELLSLVPKAEADLDAWQKLGDAAAPISQRAAELMRERETPEEIIRGLDRATLETMSAAGDLNSIDPALALRLRAAEIRRQHPEAKLDAADAATFTGPAVDHLWEETRGARMVDWGTGVVDWGGFPYGPPYRPNADRLASRSAEDIIGFAPKPRDPAA